MTRLDDMLRAYPDHGGKASSAQAPERADLDRLARTSEACFACVQICTNCADACLAESNLEKLTQCIRLNLDCAAVCHTTGALLLRRVSRQGPQPLQAQLAACTQACLTCAEECRKHASMHEHCSICANQCQECHDLCEQMMKSVRHAGEQGAAA